jgi:antitoxin ParD1/3/4
MPSSYTLGAHFETLIRELVRSGRYNNANEVVRDGLRMIEERERRLAALDLAIDRGVADAEAGRVRSINEARSEIANAFKVRHAANS